MKTIHHVVDVAATPGAIYASLTTQEGLAGWWSTRVAAPAPQPGAVIAFTFLDGFNPLMEITDVRRDRLVAWRCVGGHDPWDANTFRFEIAAEDGPTRLRFWQHYETELPDDEYGTYNFNWGYYLHSLQQLCETGHGMPFEPS